MKTSDRIAVLALTITGLVATANIAVSILNVRYVQNYRDQQTATEKAIQALQDAEGVLWSLKGQQLIVSNHSGRNVSDVRVGGSPPDACPAGIFCPGPANRAVTIGYLGTCQELNIVLPKNFAPVELNYSVDSQRWQIIVGDGDQALLRGALPHRREEADVLPEEPGSTKSSPVAVPGCH